MAVMIYRLAFIRVGHTCCSIKFRMQVSLKTNRIKYLVNDIRILFWHPIAGTAK